MASKGTITIDKSVKKLEVSNNIQRTAAYPAESNGTMLAGGNGVIRVFSPDVSITTYGRGQAVSAITSAANEFSQISLGSEDQFLNSVTITNTNTNQADRYGITANASTNDSTASVDIFTKKLDISNMDSAIRTNGSYSEPFANAVVTVGTVAHPVDTVTITNSAKGVQATYNGSIALSGEKINIEASAASLEAFGYGMSRDEQGHYNGGGNVTVNAGEEEGEGLFITGTGQHNTYGILAWAGDDTNVAITSGNVNISNFNYGMLTSMGGTIDLKGKKVTADKVSVGIESLSKGKITLDLGEEEGNGLLLKGPANGNLATYGIMAQGSDTSVSVHGGKTINVQDFNSALRAVSNGVVELGSKEAPVGDIALSNGQYGLYNQSGVISINADSFTIPDGSFTLPVRAGSHYTNLETNLKIPSETTIHTAKKAYIGAANSTTGNVVENTGSILSVNMNASDGATVLKGNLLTRGSTSTTAISLHTDDSVLDGAVYDRSGGKTTLEVRDGGTWNAREYLNDAVDDKDDGWSTSGYPNDYATNGWTSNFDTLDLSTGGTVNLGSASDRYHYVRVANMTGNGGLLKFNTDLGASNEDKNVMGHSDILDITTSSAGNHEIMVNDHSKTLKQAVGNGYVLLVHDTSANPSGSFTGYAQLQNGGVFTKVAKITDEDPAEGTYQNVPASGKNWYLTLVEPQPEPEPEPQPEPNPEPEPEPQPEPNPEPQPEPEPIPHPHMTENGENNIYLNCSRYAALWLDQDTLRKRLGELRNSEQDDGLWVRLRRGEYRIKGLEGLSDFTMYQIGYDRELKRQGKTRRFVGAAYHHTDVDFGHPRMGEDSGMDMDVASVYYTTLWDKGHYLDLVGKWGSANGKMKAFGDYPENARWSGNVYALSVEYGRKAQWDNGWYAEPQAQLTYSHLSGDSYTSSQGTHGYLEGINSLLFRTGVTLGRKLNKTEYYGKLFWNHEFSGDTRAYFADKNGDTLRDDYDFGSSWLTVGLGAQTAIGKGAYLYGDVEKNFGGAVRSKWIWNIGVRCSF